MICPACNGSGEYTSNRPAIDELKRLAASDLSYQEIADLLGRTKSWVYYHARKMKLRPRFRPELITNLEARDALAQTGIYPPQAS